MRRRMRFTRDEVLPLLVNHVAEAEIFRDNQVSISIRTSVRTLSPSFMVAYIDKETGEKAYKPAATISEAIDFAEELQVVR